MQQKNFILAIALSIGFLLLWSVFVVPRFTPPPLPTPPAQSAPAAEVAAKPATLAPAPDTSAIPSKDVFLRDERNEVALTADGGAVRSWILKLKGHEIDLVDHPELTPLPLATFPEQRYSIKGADNQATLQTALPGGLRLTKTLTLSRDGFLDDLTFRFDNPAGHPVEVKDWELGWGPGLGTSESEKKENSRLVRALFMSKLSAHAVKEGEYQDIGSWAAIDNRYFMVAFLPVEAGHPTLAVTGSKDHTRVALRESFTVPAHGHLERRYQIYAGPKGYTYLKTYHKGLEHGVDFGTFSFFGKLILQALYWLHNVTGNYGWSIVLLTIGLALLLLPLTVKSLRAQMAMKQMQPQIAALQAQYKSDPKRLNTEMMNLYKKTGSNPFGGCLPMLLQLPIFWALFTTLRNAYELRGTPWIGWIKDLSAADPYHVLPIIMAGGMYVQQRMTGAVTDPTQRQMMVMMPVMFLFMFWNFPAGLVLYWLTNSLLTMLFQYIFTRTHRQTPRVIETTIVK